MEILFEGIAYLIGEIILGFTLKILYLLFIRPILIVLGFINILVTKCVKRDTKNLDEFTYDEIEKEGGDLIIGSLVLILLGLIIGMIIYFGFYIFEK